MIKAFIDKLKAKLSVKPSRAGSDARPPQEQQTGDQRMVEQGRADTASKQRTQRSARPRIPQKGQPHAGKKPGRRKRASKPKPSRPIKWDPAVFEVPPVDGAVRFHDFDLPQAIMHAIYDLEYEYCTPIQAEILPSTLAGKDASGRAQTGTGKTAAFLISTFTRLHQSPLEGRRRSGTPRVLIIAPTRELVLQIAAEAEAMARYLTMRIVTVFGGMDYEKQKRQLHGAAIDVVVATPGRLLDFQRHKDLHLDKVEILIIDEADRMLDMGFIPDVKKIVHSTPPKAKRQTLLFSATLTPDINRLASQWTRQQVIVEIEPEKVAVETVDQKVYIVTTEEKYALLYNIITRQNLLNDFVKIPKSCT